MYKYYVITDDGEREVTKEEFERFFISPPPEGVKGVRKVIVDDE